MRAAGTRPLQACLFLLQPAVSWTRTSACKRLCNQREKNRSECIYQTVCGQVLEWKQCQQITLHLTLRTSLRETGKTESKGKCTPRRWPMSAVDMLYRWNLRTWWALTKRVLRYCWFLDISKYYISASQLRFRVPLGAHKLCLRGLLPE